MAPRRRGSSSKGLPDNLYSNGIYFRYKHPVTGKYFGMGTDRYAAIDDAKKLNARLSEKTDFVRKVLGEKASNWAELVERYKSERQKGENKKKSTEREENYRLQHVADGLGDVELKSTTQRLISNWLNDNYSGNPYTKHRGTLIKLFAFGIATGMFPDGFPNLADSTLPAIVEKKVRKPLTIEQFKAIREVASDWLKVAMDFALITLQRRSDVLSAKYSDIHGDELRVIQQKTEKHGERAYLRIKIGADLAEVIAQSRKIQPVCPFIIHRMPDRIIKHAGQEHWAQIRDQQFTNEFNKARDLTGLFKDYKKGEAPTPHEIRGLGGALYLAQGYSKEYVNLLMGHTTQRMTDSYTSEHINWTECSADLKLSH